MKNILRKSVKHFLPILLVCAAVTAIYSGAVVSHAVAYSGAGTVTDPYLITNAEQLQGMREDLSAHYKLANTVDLSGMDFKPIGRLDKPFTGSFVCELNEDNTPKYVIKNLTQEVAATEYSARFINKWEAGLFGCVEGATLYGIYILDANVVNHVQGDNQGAVVYGNYKPGMDEMVTGILIGEARNATVSNCATTGFVGGKPNDCGGLIGTAKNSGIDHCYSTATVTSGGKWNIGGLIGGTDACNVSSCFATGNVTGAQSTLGGLIGSFGRGSTAKDCYSTGNVTGGRESMTNFASWSPKSEGAVFVNCLAMGTAIGGGSAAENDATHTNCYTLAGKEGASLGFVSADLETVKTALSDGNWSWDGDTPVLADIGIVTDSSAYQSRPGADIPDTPPATGGAVQSNAAKVMEMVEALPDPELEDSVTLEHKDAIKQAYNAYEKLSTGEKDDFDGAAFGKLMKARYQVSLLLAADIFLRVEELPEADSLKVEHMEAIHEIWEDYLLLDDTLKQSYDAVIVEKIEAMHTYAEEHANDAPSPEVSAEMTSWDWALVIGSGVVIVCVIAFDVLVGIYQIRRAKKTHTEK